MQERRLYITHFFVGDDNDPGVDIYYIPAKSGPFKIQMEMKSPEGLKTLEMLESGENLVTNGFNPSEVSELTLLGIQLAHLMHRDFESGKSDA